MKYICIFILFYIFNISQSNVINDKQWTYLYKGQIDASSSASNESLARWTVSGTLIAQSFNNFIVFKFENLKTSLFNGDINDINLTEEKNIPLESEILYNPFIIQMQDDQLAIKTYPNEPLWSLNMKRAIGSHFQINFEKNYEGEFIEHSLYGDCPIISKSEKSGENIIVTKIINHENCKNNPFKHKTNVKRAEPTKHYNPLKIETIKTYILQKDHSLMDSYSSSNISYKPMPSITNSQNIHQTQKFEFLNQSGIKQFIKTEKNTEIHKLIYEIDMDSLYGKQKILSPEKQISEIVENFNNLETKFNSSLENFQMKDEDYIENMFITLSNMKTDTLIKLNAEIKEREDLLNITLLSILPYIGKTETTNYIIEFLKKQSNFEDSEYLGVRFLATFPKYVENPDEETLKKFEFLLDEKTNQVLKNAAILSFASLVQHAINKKTITDNKIEIYKNMFYNKYKNEELYETKMTYLLSLVNIGEILDVNFIIEILTNTSESKYLRALGTTAFKNRLKHESEMTFSKFWPIVKNETESFHVRVTALDLLLNSNLNEKQFDEIVDLFKKSQIGVYNQHLFSYFHTTMVTLQNTTRYTNPLGAKATNLLQNHYFRDFRLNGWKAWTTSKFRLAYTDEEPNFGRNIEASLFADPLTNSINTMQFSYNYFTMSFDMGTYSIYLKLDNVFEKLYKDKRMSETEPAISDLLDIIKEYNFKMKKEDLDFHVEIVVFVDFEAVVCVHINKDNFDKISKTIINGMSLTENIQENRISFPLMDYVAFPSDLGTSLTIKNDVQNIFAGQHPKWDLILRYNWYHQIWIESYNPIVSTPIASYKYYGQEYSVDVMFDVSHYRKTTSFYHSNDSFQMFHDKVIGTSVEDETILKTYCPKCENYWDVSNDDYIDEKITKYGFLSVSMNSTRGRRILFTNTSDEYFNSVIDSHHSISDSLAEAKPLLFAWHFIDNQYYFQTELTKGSHRSIPYYQNQTIAFFKFINHHNENIKQQELVQASNYKNYSLEFSSSSTEDDFVKLHWVSSFSYRTILENIEQIDKPKIPKTFLNFDFDYVIYNETRFKIMMDRNITFPKLNEDKFSILPAEPAIEKTVIKYCKLPEDADDCSEYSSLVLNGKFWLSDDRANSIKNTDDYKTCLTEKTGFKFTPPTKSCVLYGHKPMNEYDNYETYAGFYNFSDYYEHQEFNAPSFTYSIPSPNKMKLTLIKNHFIAYHDDEIQYWNKTLNYWQMYANPNAFTYNNYEVLLGTKRSCIISLKKVKTLIGDIIPFDENKTVALVECFKTPTRGLTIQKLNDKNIGFRFWTPNNTMSVTLVDENIKVILNGDEVTHTIVDENNTFKISFLDKNVLLIDEKEIQIYYNTEFLFTKMMSMYNSRLCGFCSYEQN